MRQPNVDLGEKQEPRRAISDIVDFKKGAGAVRNVVGIRYSAISGNMKVSVQAARSIG
jgi:hypothetical protein